MSFEKTLASVGKKNPSWRLLKNLAKIDWKIDSTNASQKISQAGVSWQIFPTYFDKKKTLFDVVQKIALVDVDLKTSLVMVRQNNPN